MLIKFSVVLATFIHVKEGCQLIPVQVQLSTVMLNLKTNLFETSEKKTCRRGNSRKTQDYTITMFLLKYYVQSKITEVLNFLQVWLLQTFIDKNAEYKWAASTQPYPFNNSLNIKTLDIFVST